MIEIVFPKNIIKSDNLLVTFSGLSEDIILKFFSENKACKEFEEVIVEYKKAFVPKLAVLKLVVLSGHS